MQEHKDFIKNTIFTFGKLIKIMLHGACLQQQKKELSFMGCQQLGREFKRAKILSLRVLAVFTIDLK